MKLSRSIYLATFIFSLGLNFTSCRSIQLKGDHEFMHYQKAIGLIIQSDEFNLLAKGSDYYSVSGELVDFFSIGGLFLEELQVHLEMDRSQIVEVFSASRYDQKNPSFEKLGTRKRAKIRLYLSQVEKRLFAIEMIRSKEKRYSFKDRPIFGTSYIYLFKVDGNGNVILISSKEIANN